MDLNTQSCHLWILTILFPILNLNFLDWMYWPDCDNVEELWWQQETLLCSSSQRESFQYFNIKNMILLYMHVICTVNLYCLHFPVFLVFPHHHNLFVTPKSVPITAFVITHRHMQTVKNLSHWTRMFPAETKWGDSLSSLRSHIISSVPFAFIFVSSFSHFCVLVALQV